MNSAVSTVLVLLILNTPVLSVAALRCEALIAPLKASQADWVLARAEGERHTSEYYDTMKTFFSRELGAALLEAKLVSSIVGLKAKEGEGFRIKELQAKSIREAPKGSLPLYKYDRTPLKVKLLQLKDEAYVIYTGEESLLGQNVSVYKFNKKDTGPWEAKGAFTLDGPARLMMEMTGLSAELQQTLEQQLRYSSKAYIENTTILPEFLQALSIITGKNYSDLAYKSVDGVVAARQASALYVTKIKYRERLNKLIALIKKTGGVNRELGGDGTEIYISTAGALKADNRLKKYSVLNQLKPENSYLVVFERDQSRIMLMDLTAFKAKEIVGFKQEESEILHDSLHLDKYNRSKGNMKPADRFIDPLIFLTRELE